MPQAKRTQIAGIRLPPEIQTQLESLAAESLRSVAAEATYTLILAIPARARDQQKRQARKPIHT